MRARRDRTEFQRGRLVRPGQTRRWQQRRRAWLQGAETSGAASQSHAGRARIEIVRRGGSQSSGRLPSYARSVCHGRPHMRRGGAIPSSGLCAVPPNFDAGWSSPVARQAHNLKVGGSNPPPAPNSTRASTRVALTGGNDPSPQSEGRIGCGSLSDAAAAHRVARLTMAPVSGVSPGHLTTVGNPRQSGPQHFSFFDSLLHQRVCPPVPAQPQDQKEHTHGVAIIFFSAAARSSVTCRQHSGRERGACQPARTPKT